MKVECQICQGYGHTFVSECPVCKGTGLVSPLELNTKKWDLLQVPEPLEAQMSFEKKEELEKDGWLFFDYKVNMEEKYALYTFVREHNLKN